METVDLQTRIDTTERDEVVFVDKYDDGVVWLSLQVRGGGARTTLTTEQAKEMIAALTRIVEAG
jgi:hypothetical protein